MSLTSNTMNCSSDNDPAIPQFNTTKLLKNARKQVDDRNYTGLFICDVDSHQYETEALPKILQ